MVLKLLQLIIWAIFTSHKNGPLFQIFFYIKTHLWAPLFMIEDQTKDKGASIETTKP